jgi:hypothetical protein
MAGKSNSEIEPTITGTVQERAMFTRLLRDLSTRAEIDANESRGDRATVATIEAILSAAESGDETAIWEAGEFINVGGRDLADVEQEVLSFTVKFGNRDDVESVFMDSEGRKFFLLITSRRLDTGEEFIWNTSAPDIVAKLIAFERIGKLPLQCKIVAIPLGGARTFLRLKAVPKRVTRSA